MFEVHIYIDVDNISAKPTSKWFGYVLECKALGGVITREGFGHILGTYHRATLVAMAKAMERLNQSCEVHIHTEDEFVLNMLENNLDHWAANGYITTKRKRIANKEEWMKIWELSNKQLILTEPGEHSYTKWLQGEIEKRKEIENVFERNSI